MEVHLLDLEGRNRIKVSVNGRQTEVYEGLTILQALLQEGIHVPHLCYDLRAPRANGNCGLCMVELGGVRDVKACQTPIREGMVITTHSQHLVDFRKVRLEQLLSDHNADCSAPCVTACPAGIEIQRYLRAVADGNYEGAVRIIKDDNPFPVVCGRVCPHHCEDACRRNLVDAPVAINHVKRFAADWDLARPTPWIPRKATPTGKRIAIVGAGPSGLSAAYYSASNGHDVTVFDKQPEPGGMMRYGIPAYRLPHDVLAKEIGVIEALGVKIMTGKALGTQISLEGLRNDFDAVYLAIGSWRATALNLEGEAAGSVRLGIEYLQRVASGIDLPLGERVVVVGGGNTAIDCARTALRLGAKNVQLLYRRGRDEMPAEPYEVEEALLEGVEMIFLAAPTRIAEQGGAKQLHCIAMALGEPDRSGRRRPVPVEGSEFTIACDTVIGAIGHSTNTQFLYHDLPVRLNPWGDIDINGRTMETSEAKVFAGGDCVTGPSTVIQAVAAGKRAATAMHDFLGKGYVSPILQDYSCSRGTLEDLPRHEFEVLPKIPRHPMPALAMPARLDGFPEVELGLDEASARAEAARCLRCGCGARFNCDLRTEATAHQISFAEPIHQRPWDPVVRDHPFIIHDNNKCISCGRCITACAEIEGVNVLVYRFSEGRLTVGTHNGAPLDQTDCVSCGQCVTACPCGALDYLRDRNPVFKAMNDPGKLVVGFIAPAPRSVIAKKFGITYDQASPFIAGLMRKVGFDKVFDFSFAADLTIMEEATEFLDRLGNDGVLPQFTSCCPGWVNLVERRYPELIPHLSSCKSPQQMMGATVRNHYAQYLGVPKDDLFIVSIVPCLAKKYEAARPEFAPDGRRDVDAVVTTTEFLEMVEMRRIDPAEVRLQEFDPPYARVSGAGVIFAASGGVAGAALRMAAEKLTGQTMSEPLYFEQVVGVEGFREARFTLGGRTLAVAVINGLGNAEPIIKRVIAGEDLGYDFIEIMACPGGCIGGAGNPVIGKVGEMQERMRFIQHIDTASTYRTSQSNPDVHRLYEDFFGEPNSALAHRLLHTSYAPFRP